MNRIRVRSAAGLCLSAALLVMPAAQAADTVIVGAVGSTSANAWPLYIGMKKGFFAAEDIVVDMINVFHRVPRLQEYAAASHLLASQCF